MSPFATPASQSLASVPPAATRLESHATYRDAIIANRQVLAERWASRPRAKRNDPFPDCCATRRACGFQLVVAGLVPAIHVFFCLQDVDAWHKAGHDELFSNACG
jgi:hypothetical protein